MNGVLLVDKPAGPTSHDVVARLRRSTGVKKVGHTGTLDPLATGVLPLVFGRATRLAAFLAGEDKEYEAEIRLGLATDTYDATGRVIVARDVPPLTQVGVEEALAAFRGTYSQTPPPFSAKHIGGTRAYALARQRASVEPAPVTVTVGELALQHVARDAITVRIRCSAGFYVRSLAHALGEHLACGGHLQALRRIRAGSFDVAAATPLETLERAAGAARDRLIPMASLLPALPTAIVTREGARLVAHGRNITVSHLVHPLSTHERDRIRLMSQEGALLAIAEATQEHDILHPAVVLM